MIIQPVAPDFILLLQILLVALALLLGAALLWWRKPWF